MIFNDLMAHPLIAAIFVCAIQVIMLYLRTLNILYTTELKILPTVVTNFGVQLTWLLSVSIGVTSLLAGQWLPIAGFMLGGIIGTYWGIIKKKKEI